MKYTIGVATFLLSTLLAYAAPQQPPNFPVTDKPFSPDGVFLCNPNDKGTDPTDEGICPPNPKTGEKEFTCLYKAVPCYGIYNPDECIYDGICAYLKKGTTKTKSCVVGDSMEQAPVKNTECVDDPRDDCEPENGDKSCSGLWALIEGKDEGM